MRYVYLIIQGDEVCLGSVDEVASMSTSFIAAIKNAIADTVDYMTEQPNQLDIQPMAIVIREE